MEPKEIFRLAVRILGLVFVFLGLYSLPRGLAQIVGAFTHFFDSRLTAVGFGGLLWNMLVETVMLVWPLFVAHWLIRGAPLIMHIAYQDSGGGTQDDKPEPTP